MDVLAHMLWANYGARVGNKTLEKKKKPLIRLAWATFWGVFPDLFAFGVPLALAIPGIIGGDYTFGRHQAFGLPATLYQYSHSIVIWATVFIIVWVILRRPMFALLGWALHILIDIFSHSGTFYPTPFLFPISDYKFLYGIPWSNTWYMIINYSLLLVVTLYFFTRRKRV